MRTWLWRILGPRNTLDDAVQDCLVELARALPSFRGEAKLETFAHRIAVRVGFRHLRASRRLAEVSLELVPPLEGGVDLESQVVQREIVRRFYRALDRLSKKRRIAFVLCQLEGLTPTEAARVAGTSATGMRSRLKHARSELRRLIGRDYYLSLMEEER